jgi:hypothetical protein
VRIGSASGRQRATRSVRSSRTTGVSWPASTVAAARALTATNQASESLGRGIAPAVRSHGATWSGFSRRVTGRRRGPPGTARSRTARRPRRNGSAAEPKAVANQLGATVCRPSHPQRCSVPPCHEAAIDRLRSGPDRAPGPHVCRAVRTRPTLPRGCAHRSGASAGARRAG